MVIKNIFNLIEEIKSSSDANNNSNIGLLVGLGTNAGLMTSNPATPISNTAIGAGVAGLSAYYLLKHLKSKKEEENKNIGKQTILR
jgi:hypothetical protein